MTHLNNWNIFLWCINEDNILWELNMFELMSNHCLITLKACDKFNFPSLACTFLTNYNLHWMYRVMFMHLPSKLSLFLSIIIEKSDTKLMIFLDEFIEFDNTLIWAVIICSSALWEVTAGLSCWSEVAGAAPPLHQYFYFSNVAHIRETGKY